MLDLDKVKKVCAEHETLAEQAEALGLTIGTWRAYRSGLMIAGVIPKLASGAGRVGRSFVGDELEQAIGKTRSSVTNAVLAYIGAANSAAGTLVWTKNGTDEVVLSFKAEGGKAAKAAKPKKGK